MATLPVDLRDLLKAGKRLSQDRDLPVRIAVLIELDATDELIDELRTQLRPRTSGAALQIEVIEPGKMVQLVTDTDAVVFVSGSGTAGLTEAIGVPRRAGVAAVVVGLGDEAHGDRLADLLLQPLADLIVKSDVAEAVEGLGAWLAEKLPSKRLALAHNFPFMRRAVAGEAVKTTAWQNGLIGAVAIIPGADMPLMTANQAKMLLQIAAAYGETLGADRIKELAVIVGGGFTFRAITRQLLTVVPVMGWAVKAGVGFGGTITMGRAAIAYFEEGADLVQVAAKLKAGTAARFPRVRHAELSAATAVQPELPLTIPSVETAVE
ncbi:MAG: hypothetical protein U1F44_05455 [Coriobacteriia bacterium]|nr:hypothetical protein [Coriobacteriia bacterium]